MRACIEDVVNTYRPKCLIIANSCVAGVIGDDVEAVGKESEVKYGILFLLFRVMVFWMENIIKDILR